ncbi:MAG: dimethyl sulfoxide reductase anchor subunit [Rhodobacteraceae bacterium]|nr:dimethyl sulfoxide reductase anchor subunit [Paracoccaceae bacterium]
MHPASSVIIFTSLSGIGFGLLFWLGLGQPAVTGRVAFVFFAIAYLLTVGGLLASTFHLGHPERAWRAFTQWKTSWLSREGWCAVLALITMALYGAGSVFFGTHWAIPGVLGAVLSLAAVFTTSMIYTQLKTVPRWHQPLTPVLFLSLSLAGGATLAGQVSMAVWLLIIAGLVQLGHWTMGDKAFGSAGTDLATATGLVGRGAVRAFEPPHTGTNYLLKEMVHVVGRKHACKLRGIGFVLMIVIPVLALFMPFPHAFGALAILSHLTGVMITRWLFFAEAEHVVGLYYGKR